MSDAANDAEPLAGSIDPIRPWTIRAVSVEVRDMAIGAARKEGISVGQWLERRITRVVRGRRSCHSEAGRRRACAGPQRPAARGSLYRRGPHGTSGA